MKADEIVLSLIDGACRHHDWQAKLSCSRCVQDAFVAAQADARAEEREACAEVIRSYVAAHPTLQEHAAQAARILLAAIQARR